MMSPPNLQSQGGHLIPSVYVLSFSFCLVLLLLLSSPFSFLAQFSVYFPEPFKHFLLEICVFVWPLFLGVCLWR